MAQPSLKVISPARGEFGLKLRYHVPIVHAIPGPKIVYCEKGEEALFPSASAIRYVDSPHDIQRRGMRAKDVEPVHIDVPPDAQVVITRPGMPEARFIPEPTIRQGVNADVVVCPRFRLYGKGKNWDAWPDVCEELCRGYEIYTFAAGQEDTSFGVWANEHAWGYDRPLDACIEAMTQAPLVVATSSGLAVLAVLCGAPLLLVTHQGLVAPGPQFGPNGEMLQARYGPAPVERLLEPLNHTGSRIETIDGWEHPQRVINRVLDILELA